MAKRGRSRSKSKKSASRAQTESPATAPFILNATAPAFTPGGVVAAIDSKIALASTPQNGDDSSHSTLHSDAKADEQRKKAFHGNPLVLQARNQNPNPPPTNPHIQATKLSPVMDSPRRQNFMYHPELRQLVFGKRLQGALSGGGANYVEQTDTVPMYGADGRLSGMLGTMPQQQQQAVFTAPQRYSSSQLLQMRTTATQQVVVAPQPRPTIFMAPQKYTLPQLFYIGRKMWGLEG